MTATQADAPAGIYLGLAAEISGRLGTIAGELRRQRDDRDAINQAIYPIQIPSQQGKVTAGGALVIASPELLGPKTGKVWDVRRVAVAGLASTSEAVTLYRGSTGSSSDAQASNQVTQITAQSSAALTGIYSPGLGACLLRAGQSLSVQGSSLTASEIITVTWDAILVPEEWLGAYLL